MRREPEKEIFITFLQPRDIVVVCGPQRVTKTVWGGVGLSNLNKTFIFIKTVRRLPKKA